MRNQTLQTPGDILKPDTNFYGLENVWSEVDHQSNMRPKATISFLQCSHWSISFLQCSYCVFYKILFHTLSSKHRCNPDLATIISTEDQVTLIMKQKNIYLLLSHWELWKKGKQPHNLVKGLNIFSAHLLACATLWSVPLWFWLVELSIPQTKACYQKQ